MIPEVGNVNLIKRRRHSINQCR